MLRLLLISTFAVGLFAQGGPAGHVTTVKTLPTKCSPKSGDVVFLIDSTGSTGSLYSCTAANTWSGSSGMTYPAAGVANSTGLVWGTSYTVGTGASNLVQLNASSQLPAVSGVNLTALPITQTVMAPLDCATAGTGTAYTCSLTPAIAGYTNGTTIKLIPNVNCAGGATTLNVDSVGNKPLYNTTGGNPAANECLSGQPVMAIYGAALNGGSGAWVLQSSSLSAGSSAGASTAVQTSNGAGGFSDSGCTATGGVITCPGGFQSSGPYTSAGAAIPLSTGTAASRPACASASAYLASDTHALTVCSNASGSYAWSATLNPSGSYACLFNSTSVKSECYSDGGVLITAVTATDVGLGSVTNDPQAKAAIYPNIAPTDGQLLVGLTSTGAYVPRVMSGGATMDSTGAVTLAGPGVSAKGGVLTTTCTTGQVANGYQADGTPHCVAGGGGGSVITSTTGGGMFLPYINLPVTTSGVAFSYAANNQSFIQFVLPVGIDVTKFTAKLNTASASGTAHCDIGVYDSSGTLLFHNALACATGASYAATAATFALVSLPAGTYFLSACSDQLDTKFEGTGGSNNLGNINGLMNTQAQKYNGIIASGCTAGVLPASVTLSNIAASSSPSVPVVYIQP